MVGNSRNLDALPRGIYILNGKKISKNSLHFKNDVEFNADLMRIVGFLGKIADFGALERYFRPEGKMIDRVVALPTVQSKLRLYCLRLSDRILILGNGSMKYRRCVC